MTAKNRPGPLDFDIFSLAPLSWIRASWKAPMLANLKARREALGILYEELAVATERGVPLDHALETVGKPASDLPDWKHSNSSLSLPTLAGALLAFLASMASLPLLLAGYLIMGPRMVDAPAIARRLAKKLHRHVVRGMPLSVAMEKLATDFDDSEAELLRIAEEGGRLPDGLRSLSRYQVAEHRLLTQTGSLAYPIFLFAVLSTIAAFVLTKILPRFVDIFAQLGIEFPRMTQLLVALSHYSMSTFLFPVLSVAMSMYVWYGLMNGGTVSRCLLFVVGAVSSAAIAVSISMALAHGIVVAAGLPGGPGEVPAMVAGGAIGVVLAVLLTPFLLTFTENLLLLLHRNLRAMFIHVPVVGAAARAERDARWLAAFSLSLDLGKPAPEAIETAGRIAMGGLRNRSAAASKLAAAGHSVGDACVRCELPGRQAAAMIAWKDSSPDFLPSLREIAADSSARATEATTRASQVVEVAAQVLLGATVGFLVIALYLPLFNIPVAIGRT